MALPRYNAGLPRDTSAASEAQAHMATSNTYNTLSAKLDQWRSGAAKDLGKQRALEAEEQAYKDTVNGEPYHKESVYTIYGEAYNNTRKATYSAEMEMDISSKSQEYSEQFKHDPEGYQNAMQGYLKGVKEETPDAAIEASLTISGEKLILNQTTKLTKAKIKATQEADLATYETYRQDINSQIINSIMSRDTAGADILKEKYATYVKSMRHSDTMSDAKRIEDLADNEYVIKRGVLVQTVQKYIQEKKWEDVQEIISEFDKEIPPGFSSDQWEKTSNSINNDFERAKRVESYEERKVVTNANKSIKEKMRLSKSGVNDGSEIATKEELATADADVQEDYRIEAVTTKYMKNFGKYSLLELEANLSKIKSDTKFSELDVKVQKRVESKINEMRAGYKSDPIGQGEILGNYKPTKPITLGMDEDEFAINIEKRFDQAGINIENAGKDAGMILKPDEVEQFQDYLNEQDGVTQLQVLSKISTLPKEQSEIIYKQLDKKGAYVYSSVGTLINQGQSKVAQTILAGNTPGLEVTAVKEFSNTAYTSLLGILNDHDIKSINNKTKVAELYHKGMIATDNQEVGTQDAIEAIYGKINEYSGKQFFMPVGVPETDFDNWIDKYEVKGDPKLTEEIRGMNDTLWDSDLQLVYKDDGKYLLKDSETGMFIQGKDRKFIELNYFEKPTSYNQKKAIERKYGDAL